MLGGGLAALFITVIMTHCKLSSRNLALLDRSDQVLNYYIKSKSLTAIRQQLLSTTPSWGLIGGPPHSHKPSKAKLSERVVEYLSGRTQAHRGALLQQRAP